MPKPKEQKQKEALERSGDSHKKQRGLATLALNQMVDGVSLTGDFTVGENGASFITEPVSENIAITPVPFEIIKDSYRKNPLSLWCPDIRSIKGHDADKW